MDDLVDALNKLFCYLAFVFRKIRIQGTCDINYFQLSKLVLSPDFIA